MPEVEFAGTAKAAGAPAELQQQYRVHSSVQRLGKWEQKTRISELLLIPSLPTFQKVDGTQETNALSPPFLACLQLKNEL